MEILNEIEDKYSELKELNDTSYSGLNNTFTEKTSKADKSIQELVGRFENMVEDGNRRFEEFTQKFGMLDETLGKLPYEKQIKDLSVKLENNFDKKFKDSDKNLEEKLKVLQERIS